VAKPYLFIAVEEQMALVEDFESEYMRGVQKVVELCTGCLCDLSRTFVSCILWHCHWVSAREHPLSNQRLSGC